MFSNVKKLEDLLLKLFNSLSKTETKRYTANQILKAQDIHLAEGASLTINMSNTILSIEIINQCMEVINELKFLLPIKEENNLNDVLNNYKNILVTKALEKTEGDKPKAAELLGLTYRQFRYLDYKRREQ